MSNEGAPNQIMGTLQIGFLRENTYLVCIVELVFEMPKIDNQMFSYNKIVLILQPVSLGIIP